MTTYSAGDEGGRRAVSADRHVIANVRRAFQRSVDELSVETRDRLLVARGDALFAACASADDAVWPALD